MELRDYLRIMRRRWRLITACLLIVVAAAAIITSQMTPQYESTARLFVSTPQTGSADAYQSSLFAEQRVQSYANLADGRALAAQVVNRLGLKMSPADLAQRITASVEPNTVILDISVTDPSAQEAQRLTQTAAEAMTGYVAQLETPPGRRHAPIKATIVDAANPPLAPVSPKPLRNVGLGVVVGLLLGFGAAVLREVLDTTVKSQEDVAAVGEAPVMGTIAYDAGASKHPLITALGSHAPRIEAFRVLRTNMQFVDVDHHSKVFVVTSSVPEEGKTTTAVNLAITLAQAGEKVLLLEGDLRRPKVSQNLGLESAVGLTTVLVGRIDLAEAVQDYDVANLSVLTSGAIPPNPAELLQSQAMSDVIAKLRNEFDVVIVDAPPLLPVTDAALLTAHSDGALIVVRHSKTTKDQLRHSFERLHAVDGRVLGAVLNMVPRARGRGGYYGDGYGYGYGYAPEPGKRAKKTATRT